MGHVIPLSIHALGCGKSYFFSPATIACTTDVTSVAGSSGRKIQGRYVKKKLSIGMLKHEETYENLENFKMANLREKL
jgi:hypothetical protein